MQVMPVAAQQCSVSVTWPRFAFVHASYAWCIFTSVLDAGVNSFLAANGCTCAFLVINIADVEM